MPSKLKKYFPWLLLAAIGCVGMFVWSAVFTIEAKQGKLLLHVFDVGQGDSLFIEGPNGNNVLIDGGPDDKVLAELGKTLPYWARSIDLVVLTHPHADHVDGLINVLKRYHVGMVLESDVNYPTPENDELHHVIQSKSIPDVVAARGEIVDLGEGAKLYVLAPFRSFVSENPTNVHDSMVVLKLAYASSSAMLMGDAEVPLEFQLIAAGDNLRADILKVGHHGSKTSSNELFLEAVHPFFAAISVGAKNRYGHPTQGVLDRLHQLGIKIFRTDEDGEVTFVSDGGAFLSVVR